jgi:hypothetical protein
LKTTTGFETNNEVEFELFLLVVFNTHLSVYLIIESLQRINTIHINAINSKARGVHTTRRTKGSRIGSIKFLTDCNFITSRTTLQKGGGFLRLSSGVLLSSGPLLSDMIEERKKSVLCCIGYIRIETEQEHGGVKSNKKI